MSNKTRFCLQYEKNKNCFLDSDLFNETSLTSVKPLTEELERYLHLSLNAPRMSKLVEMIRKKYPLLLRRKNFFQMTQQAGQDARAFLEQLKSAASEADIEGMSLEDALCLMLLSGVRVVRLKEKLSELDPPTLRAFGVLIDAHLHSKATVGQAAAANRTEGKNQLQKKKNAPKITDAEKKRRQVMKGKCFPCGSSEHMANNCKVAKDVGSVDQGYPSCQDGQC